MRFSVRIACKNIRRRPVRAALMCIIVLFLSFTAFMGGYLIISLQNGLDGYRARLGADIVVVPSSAQGHGTVDNVLLHGITGNYYIPQDSLEKLDGIEGIEKKTGQFYLTSAKASCCSVRVQMIGFDPETDFTVLPWISSSITGTLGDGDIIIGADIAYPADDCLRFYGESYRVAGQLEKTGTGLDNAVFTNRRTIRKMAESAAGSIERGSLRGVDTENAVSCVLIRVKDGYDSSEVADDINIHVSKVRATPSASMIGSVADGFGSVSVFISAAAAGIWLIAVVIMIAVFALMMNERRKEFAVLRVAGASGKMIVSAVSWEAALIGAAGSLIGLAVSLLLTAPLSESIRNHFSLPFMQPDIGVVVMLSAGAVIMPIIVGVAAAVLSALRITKNETGLLLREDA